MGTPAGRNLRVLQTPLEGEAPIGGRGYSLNPLYTPLMNVSTVNAVFEPVTL